MNQQNDDFPEIIPISGERQEVDEVSYGDGCVFLPFTETEDEPPPAA